MSERPALDELLAAHAAGRLPLALGLIVATHLALSPASRRRYRCFEDAGGVLLHGLQPAELASDAWARVAARLDEPEPPSTPSPASAMPDLPRPLRDFVPPAPDRLRWRRFGSTELADLPLESDGFRTSLITVRAGQAFPRHGHAGIELALVLSGSVHDESGHHLPGELLISDPSVEHQPVAGKDQDWLWLRVLDAPLRLTGPFAEVRRRLSPL
jgi:putative transcriptional regulator